LVPACTHDDLLLSIGTVTTMKKLPISLAMLFFAIRASAITCPPNSQPGSEGWTRNQITDTTQPNYCVDRHGIISGVIPDLGAQVFNVKSFGAMGDGVTDDTAAILEGLIAAQNAKGELFFPYGDFVVKSPLNFSGISGLKIEGENVGGRSGSASKLTYEGLTLPGTCPFEFTGDTWVEVSHLAFNSTVPVACQVLLGSASSQSEDMRFVDDSFQDGGVTVATVADFGGEIYRFVDGAIYQDGLIGALFSSSGGSGYGIASNFGYAFGAHSMSQITFRGTKMVEGNGHNLELDGTGSGIPVADISLFGVYMAGTATGSVGIYGKGNIWNLTDEGQRYEIDSATGEAAFLSGANGATFKNVQVDGLDIASASTVYSMYSLSPNTLNFLGGRINGVGAADVRLYGNLQGFSLNDPNPLSITVTGNATQDDFISWNGITTINVSGSLEANINGMSNVVWFASLFGAGSSTFTLPSNSTGFYVASYTGNSCSFTFAANIAAGGLYVVSGISNSDSAAGTLTCPAVGSVSTAPTVSATYTTTGGYFMIAK